MIGSQDGRITTTIDVGTVTTTEKEIETGTETATGTGIGIENENEIETGIATGQGNEIAGIGIETSGTTAPHLEKTAETPAMKATPHDIEDTETITYCVSLEQRATRVNTL